MNISERRIFACDGCKVNVIKLKEYAYMVSRATWREMTIRHADATGVPRVQSTKCVLCIGCLEERLGRQLTPRDFNWRVALTNDHGGQSTRLRVRLGVNQKLYPVETLMETVERIKKKYARALNDLATM